ncbi:MAG: tetratricopeptide repeat protein [Chitinivibrionales bacterium]|nr:tetratricopeptide repeat protein [Chitinivibrionales bacterium]
MDNRESLMKITALAAFFTLFFSLESAGSISVSASAEKTKVSLGEQFVITVRIVSSKRLNNLPVPEIADNESFSVARVAKNSSGFTSSIQIINGKMTKKQEITYYLYYHCAPRKTGTFVFPSLRFTLDGETRSTKPIGITVTKEPTKNPDMIVRLILSRKNLVVGEQALLKVKVLRKAKSTAAWTQSSFSGLIERVDKELGSIFSLSRLFGQGLKRTQERVGGELYEAVVAPYAVFPLSAGSYTVKPVLFEYVEQQPIQSGRRRDPMFDDFFGGDFFGFGTRVRQVPASVLSNSMAVTVTSIPPAPAEFSGSVGKFSLDATVEPESIPAGEAVTLKVGVRGNTRPGSVGEPALPDLPEFEIFSPEKHTYVDTTDKGLFSRKTYKYLAIPASEGEAIIPPVKLVYYDPDAGAFKTAASDTLRIAVTRGKGTKQSRSRYLTQAEIREVGTDIRYIKTGASLRNQPDKPYFNPIFFILYPIPFLIAVFSMLYKIQAGRQKDITVTLRKKAMKTALRELQDVSVKSGSMSGTDLLGRIAAIIERYISHKFGFPATGKMLDELRLELVSRGVRSDIVNNLTMFIISMDEYRFGGSSLDESAKGSMIEKTKSFITDLEKSSAKAKKEKKNPGAHHILIIIVLLCAVNVPAAPVEQWLQKANAFYEKKNYDSAVVYYEKIIDSGIRNSDIYYNLGNAYYRQRRLGEAILCYEKAHKLSPGDRDIIANIKFANANVVDRVPEPERGFLETVLWRLHTLFSLNRQLWLVFWMLLLLSIMFSLGLFVSGNIRLWIIYLGSLLALLVTVNGISLGYKIYQAENVTYAVVLDRSVDALNQPNGSKVLFTAHEGIKFRIRKQLDDWVLVSLPNGVSGWVRLDGMRKI